MALKFLGGMFCVAAAALLGYNYAQGKDKAATAAGVLEIRQTTSVVLAIAVAVVAVMDALQMVRGGSGYRPAISYGGSQVRHQGGIGDLRDEA